MDKSVKHKTKDEDPNRDEARASQTGPDREHDRTAQDNPRRRRDDVETSHIQGVPGQGRG